MARGGEFRGGCMPPVLGWPMRMRDTSICGCEHRMCFTSAIARRVDATLITLDRRMAAAARELGIAVEIPEPSRARTVSRLRARTRHTIFMQM